MARTAVPIAVCFAVALAGCRGCSQKPSRVDGGADAGAAVPQASRSERLAFPDAGELEVISDPASRPLLKIRERPGVSASEWNAIASLATVTASLLTARPLDEVHLVFVPASGTEAASVSAAAGALATAVLERHPVKTAEVSGVLLPDGSVSAHGQFLALRELHQRLTGETLKVPAALEPSALRVPQSLEAAFVERAAQWLDDATAMEGELPARARDQLTEALDAAGQAKEPIARFEKARRALAFARIATRKVDPAAVVARWQRTKGELDGLAVQSVPQAAHLLEVMRRVAQSWALLQTANHTGATAAETLRAQVEAELLLDEVDTWRAGATAFTPGPVISAERFASLARAWAAAGRLSTGEDSPARLGLELADSLVAAPSPAAASSLMAIAAAQDAYLQAQAARLSGVAVAKDDLELRRAAGRARRATGLPPGSAYDFQVLPLRDPADARLLVWRATTTAHLVLQFALNPALLQ